MIDPSDEIYAAMDRAGLTPGHILTSRTNMEKIVAAIRVKLLAEIKVIVQKRERENGTDVIG